MSNIGDVRPRTYPITLDKERHVKFDLNSFAELEELYGSIANAMDAMSTGSVKAVRAVLWAGLIHEEMVMDAQGLPTGKYNITPLQVGSFVKVSDLKGITKVLYEAMEEGLPEVDKDSIALELANKEGDIPAMGNAIPN